MTAALDCAPSVQPAFGLKVGGVGFFGGVKATNPLRDLPNVQERLPSLSICVPDDAEEPAFGSGGRLSLVLPIRCLAYVSQVFNSVVRLDAVDVVDDAARGASADVQPREAMRPVQDAINGDAPIPLAIDTSGRPVFGRSTAAPQPSEISRCGIVVKKLAQTLRGKIISSHFSLHTRLIGQKPACVSSASRASLFYVGVGS